MELAANSGALTAQTRRCLRISMTASSERAAIQRASPRSTQWSSSSLTTAFTAPSFGRTGHAPAAACSAARGSSPTSRQATRAATRTAWPNSTASYFYGPRAGDIWTLDDVGAINLMLAINSQFHDPIAGIDLTRTRPGVAYNESQGRSHFFVPAGDALFFAAYDDIDGNEPWLYHISEHRWITYTDLEDRAPPGYSGTSCSDWNATHPHTMPNLIGSVNHIYRADDCLSLCDALLTCTHVQLRYRQTTGANHDMSYDRVANQRLECWLLSGDYSTTGMDIHIESAGHWSGFEAADGGDGTTHSRRSPCARALSEE